jgi:hypothetical protein
MPPSVYLCNASKTHVEQNQIIQLTTNATGGSWPLSGITFYMNALGYANTSHGAGFATKNYTIATTQTSYTLSCCATDSKGNMKCLSGPGIYPTSECGGNIYDLNFATYIKCLYQKKFGGDI